jgi:hypothetical protein
MEQVMCVKDTDNDMYREGPRDGVSKPHFKI